MAELVRLSHPRLAGPANWRLVAGSGLDRNRAAFPDRDGLGVACGSRAIAQRALGCSAGIGSRLYLLEEDSGKFVGHAQYGFAEGSEGALAFKNHAIRLEQTRFPGEDDSSGPEPKEPAVLAFHPDHPNGALLKTPSGLPVTNVLDTDCPRMLRKAAGSYWIDFPLYCREGNTPLGMLALSCPPDLQPEHFEILRILAEVAGALLAAIQEHEAVHQQQVAGQRKALETAFGATAHHLRARISALGILEKRYEAAANGNERLAILNHDFSRLLKSLDHELQHIRDRLKPIAAQRIRKDILALLRHTLRDQLPPDRFTLTPEQGRCLVDFDAALLAEVVEELVANARKAIDREDSLHLDVAVCPVGDDRSSDTCVISFCDNGPGIPQPLRERVFRDLYSQWPGKERGSGLGLGFIQRIMRAHDGTVRIAETDKGTCFILDFARFVKKTEGAVR